MHVVGSNNNLGDVAPVPAEWEVRDRATNEWMREAFEDATESGAAAVLLVIQANPGFDESDPTRAPSRDLGLSGRRTVSPKSSAPSARRRSRFPSRSCWSHGDSHYFRVDKPLLDAQGRRVENFTRVETPGDNPQSGNNDVQWVKALVEPRSREVFSFQPQVVPDNRVAVPAP